MSIRTQVMAGIISAATLLGGAYFAGSEAGRALSGKDTVIGTVYKSTKEKVEGYKKDIEQRIENEKAIKAYGIQAKSYAEAKQKLDSIRFNEICAELGVKVPQKPKKTGDVVADLSNEIAYEQKVNDIYTLALVDDLEELIQKSK